MTISQTIVGAAIAVSSCAAAPTQPTGAFTVDALIRSLEQQGAMVARAGSVPPSSHPYFSVSGERLTVSGADVTVFAYPSVDRAAGDAAKVSPTGSSIGLTQISWMDTPHFYRRDRVVVLYVGHSADLLKMLDAVLGAPFAAGR